MKPNSHRSLVRMALGCLALAGLAQACDIDSNPDDLDVGLKQQEVEISEPIHHDDRGECGPGSHMCCDAVGQFQCLTDSPVGPNLCPPGFDEPCDGDGPPVGQCGPGNHACCDLTGQVQCLADAPPGQLNLCPPGFDHC